MTDKKLMGKKSKASGARFELRVRKDLEKKNWVVDKWTNNVSDFPEENINLPSEERKDRKLIPAKPKFVFNLQLKRRIPIGMSSGFPDFIAFTKEKEWKCYEDEYEIRYTNKKLKKNQMAFQCVIGVEVKSHKYLDKEEKEKCKWLLDNKIFSKILIASKGIKRGEIKYIEFEK